MSEGERVVFERRVRVPQSGDWRGPESGAVGFIPVSVLYEGNTQPEVLWEPIPDPVPGLQARIAELEGVLKHLSDHWTNAWARGSDGDLMRPHEIIQKVERMARDVLNKPPTPAAAKEQ